MAPNLRWMRRLTALVRGNQLQNDLEDELLFHIEARTRDNIASGMSPDEARHAAQRAFGNRTLIAERTRDADVNTWVDNRLRDVRYAMRMLWRNPGFTTVVVLSMALGIGANTAVFTLLNAAVLRPLALKNPEELVTLEARAGRPEGERPILNWQTDLRTFQTHAGNYIDVFTATWKSAATTIDGQVELVPVGLVSGNYHSVLGVRPALGRLLDRDDDREGDPRLVAVLDYDFWQRRFGGDPAIANRQIVLNGVGFSIVGVTPRGFTGTSLATPPGITIPAQAEARISDGQSFRALEGRLRPNVSREQAASVLTSLYQALPRHREDVIVAQDNSRGEYRDRDRFEKPLYVLMGAVVLVLLIASANVAGLLLARGAARQREISIRLAMGASRGRIASQMLTESVVIALIGGALGVWLAYAGAGALVATLSGGDTTLPLDVGPDARVLTFTTCIAVATGLLFGLFPAFQASRAELTPTLKEAAAIVGRRPRLLARRALVVVQVRYRWCCSRARYSSRPASSSCERSTAATIGAAYCSRCSIRSAAPIPKISGINFRATCSIGSAPSQGSSLPASRAHRC